MASLRTSCRLFLRNRLITGPFQLLRANENGLTFALGFALQRSPRLLAAMFSYLGLTNTGHLTIRLQEREDEGITDITITDRAGTLDITIEAKIGGWPGIEQLSRYAKTMRRGLIKKRILIALGVPPYSANLALTRQIGGVPLVRLRWTDILAMVQEGRHRCGDSEKELLRDLENFIQEVIGMQSYDREVLIRDLNVTNTSYLLFLDYNLYRCQTSEIAEPLFFAPCITGAESRANLGIQHFSRVYYRAVVKMSDPDSIREALDAARRIITEKTEKLAGKKTTREQMEYLEGLPEKWARGIKFARSGRRRGTDTFFFLGDPIRLPSVLRKEGKMVPIGFSMTIEQLLGKGEGSFRC